MPKSKITLQTLYDLLQGHDQRFDSIDQRFDAVDQRFDVVDQRFDVVDQRFDVVDQRFDAVDQRFDSIESLQRTMAVRLVSIEGKVDEHSAILGPLQERVDALHGLVERLDVRFERLEQEYTMITAALRRLETDSIS